MILGVPKESASGERRVALVPESLRALTRTQVGFAVEAGAGVAAGFDDDAYAREGARIEPDRAALFAGADVLLTVQPPRELEAQDPAASGMRRGTAVIGLFRPLDRPELATRLAGAGLSVLALELLPRITRAQSMDALSSQSTIAGYRAVLLAAVALPRLFPMLVTAAGTISPSRVFVVGAGVAGLQAIATARRLGAVVEAYDLRPVVREQVESLGARFVELSLETADAEDRGGYARAQSEEFYARQRELMRERAAASDVVITTALVPGRRAPLLFDEEAVRGMRRGSVIVDLAAEQGGNCALTVADQPVHQDGVLVLGPTNLPSQAPFHASQTYARNVTNLLLHLLKEGLLNLDLEDEITRGTLLCHEGKVVAEAVRARLDGDARGAA